MKTQWQIYQELELLPTTLQAPQAVMSPVAAYLGNRWRSLLDRQTSKLDYEQQVDYLERRLALNGYETTGKASAFRQLWKLLNQPLNLGRGFGQSVASHPEPEIRQTLDTTGHRWWQVYDPLTGQTTYLESEAEVQIWLEERLYY